jgi:hypothetical protein
MDSSFAGFRLSPLASPRAADVDFDEPMPTAFVGVLETAVLPREWTTDGMMETGAALRPGRAEGEHWFGGPPEHSGNACPLCHHPIQQLLSLDLQAGGIRPFLAREFAPLQRLPLFFCFRCHLGTIYRVVSDSAMQTLRPRAADDYRPEEDDSEFIPFYYERWDEIPLAFERRGCDVVPIPREIHLGFCDGWQNMLNRMHRKKDEPMPPRAEAALAWLGIENPWDLVRSQFGGFPIRSQGYWSQSCPNPACPSYVRNRGLKPDLDGELLLRPLAVLSDDCGLEWNRRGEGSIEFDVCPCCLTIQAHYACT